MQDQFDPDSAAAWQVRLYKKSLTQQTKLKYLCRFLSPLDGKRCLDIGGGNGVLPFLLRRQGGEWMSAEFSPHAVQAMVDLFGAESVVELQEERLPFDEDTFDTIVIIDGLEQIRKDAEFLKDCHRCLKPGGELIVHVHHLKSFSIIRGVRKLLGLTDEKRGFVRPGYRMRDLYEISKDGFDMVESAMYGGFGVQFFDAWIQSLAGPGTSYSGDPAAEQGQILSQQDLRKFSKQYRVSCILYPVMKFAAGLDAVFAFTCNHDLVVQARPRPWQQRKSVRMRDGRSIADATINTRIGSAADLTDPKNNRSSAG